MVILLVLGPILNRLGLHYFYILVLSWVLVSRFVGQLVDVQFLLLELGIGFQSMLTTLVLSMVVVIDLVGLQTQSPNTNFRRDHSHWCHRERKSL